MITWVNSAKGIGIILVIFGHLLYSSNLQGLNQIIYAFHIPLFFILSGYVQKCCDIRNHVLQKIHRLLIPFLCHALLWVFIFGFDYNKQSNLILSFLLDCFYITGEISNNPLWFLVVLFEVHILCLLLNLQSKNSLFQVLLCFVFFSLGFIAYSFSSFVVLNFLGFNRTIVCFSFFVIGLLYRRVELQENNIVFAITAMLFITFGIGLNTKVSIYGFNFGNNYFSFLMAAVTGSITVIQFCKRYLNTQNYFADLSQYAILFLGTQYYWILPFRAQMDKIGLSFSWYYNVVMLLCVVLYVRILPVLYERIKILFPFLKYLNGDI